MTINDAFQTTHLKPFVATLLWFLICLTPSIAVEPYHSEQATKAKLNIIEEEITQWVQSIRQKNESGTIEIDSRLVNMTRNLAATLAASEFKLNRDDIQGKLLAHGITDAKFYPQAVASDSTSMKTFLIKLKVTLAKNFSKTLLESRNDRMGIGVISQEEGFVASIIVLRRLMDLGVLPREVTRNKPLPVIGNIFPGISKPRIYITKPDGVVAKQELATLENNTFSGQLTFKEEPGRYKIEMMVDTELGPTVANLFPLYIDVPYDTELILTPKNLVAAETYASVDAAENAFSELVNAVRKKNKLSDLTWDRQLQIMARGHSNQMKQKEFFGHTTPEGQTLKMRAQSVTHSYSKVTENLAQNSTLTEAMDKLMDSPAHRGNILDPELTDFGVGIAIKKNTDGSPLYIVTQNFGKRFAVIEEKSFLIAVHARVSEIAAGIRENEKISKLARHHSEQMKIENKPSVNLANGNLFTHIKNKVSGIASQWGQVYRIKDVFFLKELSPPAKNWREYGIGIVAGTQPGEYYVTLVFTD
jgi:uncharacterized protein YkwD